MKLSKNKYKILAKKSALIWFITGLMVVGNVYVAIQASTSGARISQLEGEKEKTAQESQRLSSELIELNSLKGLEKNAEDLGFSKPATIIYITSDATVAKIP